MVGIGVGVPAGACVAVGVGVLAGVEVVAVTICGSGRIQAARTTMAKSEYKKRPTLAAAGFLNMGASFTIS
ncbi:MAG: hypothetical protein L0177_03100 [Chloroflexi bacterium]|nr:hypothetical protein [Chloroflexota bacterium]